MTKHSRSSAPQAQTYLVDEGIGIASSDAFKRLQAGGMLVEGVAPGTADATWAAYAGNMGWPVLTKDRAIITRPRIPANALTQKNVWKYGARLFICMGDYPIGYTVANILRAHNKLNGFCRRRRTGRAFIAKLYMLEKEIFDTTNRKPEIKDYILWTNDDAFERPTKGAVRYRVI